MASSPLPSGAKVQAGTPNPTGGQGVGTVGASARAPQAPSAMVARGAPQPEATAAGSGSALIPAPRHAEDAGDEPGFGPLVARLPVELDVGVPVRGFRVRNLLALEPGTVVESQWNHGNDLPLAAGEVKLAWTEFEVVETQLGVRVTRLA